ncbi:MAG: hypothetical protein PHH82_04430 [Candidatus ainarchaeum sp.]|nr:hypothetical protein [Candidatus ainarchaeum sp.]
MDKKVIKKSKIKKDEENNKLTYKKENYCSAPHCQDPSQDG